MDPIYHQQMHDVLNTKSARPKEQSWQQLGIMLPILRNNASKNIIRNEQLDVDPTQELLNQARVIQNTMHTPAALTSPNIFSQNRKAKRNKPASYDLDN